MISNRLCFRIGLAHLWTALVLIPAVSAQAREQTEAESPDVYFCTTCHGVDGRGNEGVQAPRLAGMEPWYLRRQLQLFKAGIRGKHPEDLQGLEMQPMAAILTTEEINDIVEWVGSWSTDQPPEPTLAGDIGRGQEVYRACVSCHGKDGMGNQAMLAPALVGQNDWYLLTQLKNFKSGYRGTHPADALGAQMRSVAQALPGEQAMIDLLSYINTLPRD